MTGDPGTQRGDGDTGPTPEDPGARVAPEGTVSSNPLAWQRHAPAPRRKEVGGHGRAQPATTAPAAPLLPLASLSLLACQALPTSTKCRDHLLAPSQQGSPLQPSPLGPLRSRPSPAQTWPGQLDEGLDHPEKGPVGSGRGGACGAGAGQQGGHDRSKHGNLGSPGGAEGQEPREWPAPLGGGGQDASVHLPSPH